MGVAKTSTAPFRHHLDKRAHKIVALNSGNDEDLLSTFEIAMWLDLSVAWLEIARHRGYGPSFIRVSARMIRYRRGDVIAWLRERTHACTNEYARRGGKVA